MTIVLVLVVLLLLVFGPQWWATYTFRRYAGVLPRIAGTGGELARHLLDRFGLPDVPVEPGKSYAWIRIITTITRLLRSRWQRMR